MKLENFKQNVFGDSEDRAVSPVIGVVLMVAIVVLLAAVVAGVMTGMVGDMGQTEAQGAAEFDVDQEDDTITVEVTALTDADSMEIRGDVDASDDRITGLKVGDTVTLEHSSDFSSDSGTITAVAVKETEDGETISTTVGSQDYDFSS